MRYSIQQIENVIANLKLDGQDEDLPVVVDMLRAYAELQASNNVRQIMDGNAWRAALIGLCVTTREADVDTPEKAAANVRARLERAR